MLEFGNITKFNHSNRFTLIGYILAPQPDGILTAVFSLAHRLVGLIIAPLDVAPDQITTLRRNQQQPVHADQLLHRVTGLFRQLLVAVENQSLVVNGDPPEGGIVQGPEPLLAFA